MAPLAPNRHKYMVTDLTRQIRNSWHVFFIPTYYCHNTASGWGIFFGAIYMTSLRPLYVTVTTLGKWHVDQQITLRYKDFLYHGTWVNFIPPSKAHFPWVGQSFLVVSTEGIRTLYIIGYTVRLVTSLCNKSHNELRFSGQRHARG